MRIDNNKKYGIEHFGRLKSVLLHRPSESIKLINNENKEYFLFKDVPNVDTYLEEHKLYEDMLKGLGVEVFLLDKLVQKNTDLLHKLPNLAYLHDIAVISSQGSIISKMASLGRCHEEIVVKEALRRLEIPILYESMEGEAFEGCLLLSPNTVFVADTERHNTKAIEAFIDFILGYFDEVIYASIPQEPRFMHPDMVLNRVTDNLLLYFPNAFKKTYYITKDTRKEIDIKEFMNSRKIDMIPVSDDEQKKWGTSFVPLEPGIVINYDISLHEKTISLLEREGVVFKHFHPKSLLAGGGSLRCLTLRIWRELSQ